MPPNWQQIPNQPISPVWPQFPNQPMPQNYQQFSNTPLSQNWEHSPNASLSQYSCGFNSFAHPAPSGAGSTNENYGVDESDEEDGDEEDAFDPLLSQQNFTQLLSQQPNDLTPNIRENQSEKRSWSRSETTALISAYMNTSTDTIIGTQQKKGVFWGRVLEAYNAARENNEEEISERTASSLKGRWIRISDAVSKWCGSMDKARARKSSGKNEDDVLAEAHTIHQHSFGKFGFYDEWVLLKKWDKYRSILGQQVGKPQRGRPSKEPALNDSLGSGSSGKRRRDEGDGSTPNTPTSGFQDDEFVPRPEGVKKAKSRLKGKEPAHTALDSFGERLQLYGEIQSSKLELEKQKEARKKKKMELEERNMQMQQLKMNWEMLQQLSAKQDRTPWEENMMQQLQSYLEQYRGF